MKGRLFILNGASGSGKTELLNNLQKKNEFNIVKANKYSTRDRRNDNDDIIHCSNIDSTNFDLVYNLSGNRYGIKYSEIEKQLNENKNVFLILSYIRIVKILKQRYKDNVTVIYISSALDSERLNKINIERNLKEFNHSKDDIENLRLQFKRLKSSVELTQWEKLFECMSELNSDWKKFIPLNDSLEIRTAKIRDFHKSYLDNIHIYDHVILNYKFDEGENGIKGYDMYRQGCNIMNYYLKGGISKSQKLKPVIFVVAAAPVAGKGILLETIGDTINKSIISIILKQGKREKKDKDKRDGMIAIGKNGVFDEVYDIRWEFHKDEITGKGTEYAISSKQINENSNNGCSQIVISNMEQFEMFNNKYGERIVFIYLHRLQSREDREKFLIEHEGEQEANKKLTESDKVYEDYIEKLVQFDHVLLNTSFQEDLYEQIFTLIDHYNN